MSETFIDRRQLIVGVAATAVIASMPTVAAATAAGLDPAIERMKGMFHQLLDLLRSEGYAVARLNDGVDILFFLSDRADITSMEMVSLGDIETPGLVETLKQAASIESTLVRILI